MNPTNVASARAIFPWRSLAIRQVELSGILGSRLAATLHGNMLQLDLEGSFFRHYRLDSSSRARRTDGGFTGLGQFVDALARLAAVDTSPAVRTFREELIATIESFQESDGYIGIMPPALRFGKPWDAQDAAYLVHGLVAQYQYHEDETALRIARRLGDWLLRSWPDDPATLPNFCVMALIGVETAFLKLYAVTDDKRYLDFCMKTRNLAGWQRPILLGRWNKIDGHAYDYLSRCVAQLTARQYVDDPRLDQAAHLVTRFMLDADGMTVTGGVGDHECWHNTQEGTVNFCETCASAYTIRMLQMLLMREVDARLADVIERIIHNALFAAQSPDGRRIRYYTPMDGPREYFHEDTYCCPNNYRRIVAELPELVAATDADGIILHQYSAGRIAFDTANRTRVRLDIETAYPRSGRITIRLAMPRPDPFALRLRIPGWSTQPAIRINGEFVSVDVIPGAYSVLSRTWHDGDRIDLDLGIRFRLIKGREVQAGRVAVLYGPLVFCLARRSHPQLEGIDLRNLVFDPAALEPITTPEGEPLCCRIRAWSPGRWYPFASSDLMLTLTEYTDPDGELVYLKVPVPNDPAFVDDELLHGPTRISDVPIAYYGQPAEASETERLDGRMMATQQSAPGQ